MKIMKFFIVIVVFIVGYIAGNFLPFSGFGDQGIGIVGSAKLEVTILDENNKPVTALEVDVAEKPGPPQIGGAIATDAAGVATFNIQPGNYFVYFNSGNFPENFEEPEFQQVQVSEGTVSKVTMILKAK